MAIIQVNIYVNCVLKRRSGLIAVPTLYCGGIAIVAICQRTMQSMYGPFELNMSLLNRMLGVTTQMLFIQTLFSVSTVKKKKKILLSL